MAARRGARPASRRSAEFRVRTADDPVVQVTSRLGGHQTWKKMPVTMLDVHEAIEKGLPSKALKYVVSTVRVIPSDKVFEVLHISRRTLQRRAGVPDKPLNKEQSGRLWKFAEILNTASRVFGDQQAAERWLNSPAIALEQRSPMDLLTTPAGAEIVEQLLGRLEHGVYT